VRHANVFDVEFEYDPDDPPGYQAGIARIGRDAGGRDLVVKLYEIPPGESLCPYHYEYVEEWLIVLLGELEVRTPDGAHLIGDGAVVCFPPGSEGAHKLTNNAAEAARVIMFSSGREPSVSVYPDSDKIGVWPGNEADQVMLRRADGDVPYYDGET
jgi:uncharacterized cupin superfamily protein